MKFKKLLFGLFVSSVLFVACSKDDNIDDVANKLQHRWAVTDALLFAGAPINDTIIYYSGTGADYFDFKSNGKVYSSLNGAVDSSDYRIIAGNKIVVDSDTAEIRVLTNSKLELFTKNTDNNVTQETTVKLNR